MNKKDSNDKPFFLSVGLFNTHRDFLYQDPEIQPKYVMPPYPMYDNPQNRKDMAGYASAAKMADDCIGMVLQALRESGLEEETLVIYTTDHGLAFPRMKCSLFDSGIGVGLIMKLPGILTAGTVVDALVSQLDIFPTLCELLHAEPPAWLQGYSLMPLLTGDQETIRDAVFSEINYHIYYQPMRCIRTERYKYIVYFHDPKQTIDKNIDGSSSKDFLIQHGLSNERPEMELLFDLYLDPVERVNVCHDPEYQEICQELKQSLTRWMEETEDPLLDGQVPAPEGANVIIP